MKTVLLKDGSMETLSDADSLLRVIEDRLGDGFRREVEDMIDELATDRAETKIDSEYDAIVAHTKSGLQKQFANIEAAYEESKRIINSAISEDTPRRSMYESACRIRRALNPIVAKGGF